MLRPAIEELVVGVVDRCDSPSHCRRVEFQIVAVKELGERNVQYHALSYQHEKSIFHLVHWCIVSLSK